MLTAAGFEKALAYWPMFLQGVVCTVALSALTVVFGFILALLLAVMRLSNIYPFRSLGLTKDGHLRDGGFLLWLSRFNPLRFVSTVYVELFRATPMVVQIFLIFYVVFADIKVLPGFKLFGFIRFDRFFPAVVALALNSGAYLSEIIRSGIQSIDGGQTEAARSLGWTAALCPPLSAGRKRPAALRRRSCPLGQAQLSEAGGGQDFPAPLPPVGGRHCPRTRCRRPAHPTSRCRSARLCRRGQTPRQS